jgi:type III restriction enzyme
VAFLLAKLVLEIYFRDDEGALKPWLFPQLLDISKQWLRKCLTLKDNTFLQLLLLLEPAHDAAERIYNAIVASVKGEKSLKPILKPYDTVGSTGHVDFNTTRGTYATLPEKCHVSHVVLDSDWEAKMAETLESMEVVVHYVKNYGVGFFIPYTLNGEEKNYYPDYLVQAGGDGKMVNLIIEVTGERKKDKEAKVAAAWNLWVPAVNNHGGFGRWAFLEISDPWDAAQAIRAAIQEKGVLSQT